MTPEMKELIIDALRRYRGDDASRTRHAFRGLTEKEMGEQYGQSGKSRRQILNDYEDHERAVDAAILEVKFL